MKIQIIVLFIFISLNSYSQYDCDKAVIEEIVNIQLKITDKYFRRPYILCKTSTPYDSTKYYYNLDSIYNRYNCGKSLDWSDFNVKSKYGIVESDTSTNKEYRLFISAPIFNESMDKCRFYISYRYSEWGGQGRLCFYEKKKKKWKYMKSTLLIIYN